MGNTPHHTWHGRGSVDSPTFLCYWFSLSYPFFSILTCSGRITVTPCIPHSAPNGIQPTMASIQDILEYSLCFQSSGLVLSSMRVHLAAISMFHPPGHGKWVFSNAIIVWFLKGLNLHPLVWESGPLWDLNTVVAALMNPLFEPLASCPFPFLCQNCILGCGNIHKESLWVAALMAEPPYEQFTKHNVTLWLLPYFLSKVVSRFHLNQAVYLPVFFLKLHSSPEEKHLHMLDFSWCLLPE